MYAKIPLTKITKIAIIKTDCKLTLQQVVAQYHPKYAINGGLYDMGTSKVNPIPLRIDGETIATSSDGYWMMAWNTGPDICMIHSKDMCQWQNAVACSTMLKDGKETIFTYTSAQGGIRGRTAFGNDKENLHLFVTTDNNGPLSPNSLRTKMKTAGCQNAIMLDCGGSSQGYMNGIYLQSEDRKVAYWICIWLEGEQQPTIQCPYREPTITVKINTIGEPAKWVQWHLQKAGYNIGKLDGWFGKKSAVALMDFQKKNGLTIDGMCGKMTRAKLKEV